VDEAKNYSGRKYGTWPRARNPGDRQSWERRGYAHVSGNIRPTGLCSEQEWKQLKLGKKLRRKNERSGQRGNGLSRSSVNVNSTRMSLSGFLNSKKGNLN
jgi:hypothetical protein